MQFAVYLAHEFMEMQTRFPLDWYSFKKTIHQKTFTPPHPAKHVNTPWNRWPIDHFFECVGAFTFVGCPLGGTALQGFDSPQLCGVALKASKREFFLVILKDGWVRWHKGSIVP